MTDPIPYLTPITEFDFRNRKGRLLVLGIIMVVLGAMSGCLGLATPLTLLAPRPAGTPPVNPGVMIAGAAFYLLIAGGMIWIGIGSIRAQRWTRPLVLILSMLVLIGGSVGCLAAAIAAPSAIKSVIATTPAASSGAQSTAIMIGVTIGIGALSIFYIGLPITFFCLFRSDDVHRTLEFHDPVARWTERCPIPVLGISVACALAALIILTNLAYLTLPIFGTIVTGAGAAALIIIMSLAFAAAAILTYRLNIAGWALAVGLVILMQTSMIVSAARLDMPDIMANMHATTQEVDLLRKTPLGNLTFITTLGGVYSVASVAYAFSVRKYFKRPASA